MIMARLTGSIALRSGRPPSPRTRRLDVRLDRQVDTADGHLVFGEWVSYFFDRQGVLRDRENNPYVELIDSSEYTRKSPYVFSIAGILFTAAVNGNVDLADLFDMSKINASG